MAPAWWCYLHIFERPIASVQVSVDFWQYCGANAICDLNPQLGDGRGAGVRHPLCVTTMAHSHEGSSRARRVSSGSFNLSHTSANVRFLDDLISFQIMHTPNMATRGDRTSSQDCSTVEITSADTAHPDLPRRRVQCPHVSFASLKFADIEKQTMNPSAVKGCTTGLIAG